jgi:hypothetical protein
MRRFPLFTVFLMLAVAAAVSAFPAVAETNINFFLGQKMLDDDADPVEDQGEFGVLTTFGNPDWPVQLAADLLVSADSEDEFGIETTVVTSELAFGARKIWEKGKVRPFVAGGIAIVSGMLEVEIAGLDVDDDESALGTWVEGGVFWRLGQKFNIGFEVRASWAEIDLFGADFEAGGEHVGLLLGWGF